MQRTLDDEERYVAWAVVGNPEADDPGAGVVVTNRGLWLPGRDARLGWHEIHKVIWDGQRLAIVAAREVADLGYHVMVDEPQVEYLLPEPDRVPEQVRTRVDRSIASTTVHELSGGGQVRIVARRVSGVNGLRWTVRYSDGPDADRDEVAAATAALVAEAMASIEGVIRW